MLCLSGVNTADIKNLLDFMYNGEIQIFQDDLEQFFNEQVSVTSTSGPEKSIEEKAAGYDVMSLQVEKLKAEMIEM